MDFSFNNWKKEMMSDTRKGMLVLSFPCIQLLDISVKELLGSAQMQAKGMLKVAEELPKQSALVSMMDLSLEADAFGSSVEVYDDEVPTVVGCIVNDGEDANALEVPELSAGRCQIYIDAIKEVMDTNPDRPVFAGVIGPYSLAGRLMDVTEIMIQCMMDPDYVKTVLKKATDFLKKYIQAYKDAGANGVVMAEPLAGLLSPDMLEEFSSVYIKEIVDALQDDHFAIIYHNCGPSVTSSIDEILSTGCSAYHFGNAIDIMDILENVDSDVLVMGNIDPVEYFRNGTPETMDQAVQALLEKTKDYKNFVISSGCDIPPMAKWDNIRQFFTSIDKYNQK